MEEDLSARGVLEKAEPFVSVEIVKSPVLDFLMHFCGKRRKPVFRQGQRRGTNYWLIYFGEELRGYWMTLRAEWSVDSEVCERFWENEIPEI